MRACPPRPSALRIRRFPALRQLDARSSRMIVKESPTPSEESIVQQPHMFADVAQEEHLCIDYGVDIARRSSKALPCETCSYKQTKERAKNYYLENRKRVLEHVTSYRQTPGYRQKTREWRENNPDKVLEARDRQRQRHREEMGYNPTGRTCEECGADISHRGHRAKRCVPCSSPSTRTCVVCQSTFRAQGTRTQYCGEQCSQQDQRAKESTGYTKICTKCKEGKPYGQFGLHNNRRRSTCKVCEVKDQSERYSNITPVQRDKRNGARRISERSKKANYSLGQRAMVRTKMREANRLRKLGFAIR